MHQFFICNQDEVEAKLKTLTKMGTSTDGWTHYYVDNNSKEEWLLTRYDSEYHGGGVPVLKRIPEPALEELIDIAMTSAETNDIIGASLELSEREKYKKEDFRTKLLNRLLQVDTSNLTDFEKERLKIIIYESDLYDATNRRNIVGKHFTEIESDADYYRTAAHKAKSILENIAK
jgi:Immunity protein 27